ncbi:A/G-specific adenine glycosylase [bacterium]|nr:A/G-specific adenine glycosylase [candidate division CSSED10-310 bacterium]
MPGTSAIDHRAMDHLMRWFDMHQRRMPWRGESDPYRIWISEVMLQQTQVATVVPYYQKWMRRFPTIHSLAESNTESVMELWQGLGYYSRAGNLLLGARYICDQHQGHFPQTRQEALRIPGVGEYIAGAVLSIAFNYPEPAVDGNVIRVLSRLRAISESSPSRIRRAVADIVGLSYWEFEPRWVNQAWMELGALQCIPHPACTPCPFATVCMAFSTGKVAEYPLGKKKKTLPLKRGIIYIVRRDNRILMVKRPAAGLLANLWELPNVFDDDQDPSSFLERHNLTPLSVSYGTVRHAYSHFKLTCEVRAAELSGPWQSDRWVDHRWMSNTMLAAVGKPKLHIMALRKSGF